MYMKVYYRISNNSNDKLKLPSATKEACLHNALRQFQPYVEDFFIIADNVTEQSLQSVIRDVEERFDNVTVSHTSLGNAGSFWFIYQKAIELSDDSKVYFLEDDYIHRPNSYRILSEGLDRADYVTLYDHSDMYKNYADGGDNPFIENGGEDTRVILTDSSHFKMTISTTLTFATTTRILREDFDLWKHYTGGIHVSDFHAFVALRNKRRTLITPIPGYSTHACIGYLSPLVDWEAELKEFI